jgi:hypothetical protein
VLLVGYVPETHVQLMNEFTLPLLLPVVTWSKTDVQEFGFFALRPFTICSPRLNSLYSMFESSYLEKKIQNDNIMYTLPLIITR